MARDLAPLVEGAAHHRGLVGLAARSSATPSPSVFGRAIAGRRVLRVRPAREVAGAGPVGRRVAGHPGEDDRPALRAARGHGPRQARAPAPDARSRTAGRWTVHDGPRWLLFRDVRKFGRVGLYRRTPDGTILGAGERGRAVRPASGPSRSTTHFTLRRLPGACCGGGAAGSRPRCWTSPSSPGVGNIYADESLWRARLHPLRSADSLNTRPGAAPLRGHPRRARRGHRASWLIGRRLHRARG